MILIPNFYLQKFLLRHLSPNEMGNCECLCRVCSSKIRQRKQNYKMFRFHCVLFSPSSSSFSFDFFYLFFCFYFYFKSVIINNVVKQKQNTFLTLNDSIIHLINTLTVTIRSRLLLGIQSFCYNTIYVLQ